MAWRVGGGVVVAAAAVIVIAGAGKDGLPGSAGSADSPGPPDDFAARLVESQNAARRGDLAAASSHLGMRPGASARRHDANCAAHSYGRVRRYLLATPCRGLDRLLFTLRGSNGGTIAVAVAWVEFGTPPRAAEFRRIDDIWGTGQIAPLPGARAGIPNVRLSGQHYRSGRTGTLAVVAEAEPVTGSQTDAFLDSVAGVAVLLPHATPPGTK